jgi:GxxExxY protein
MGFGFLGSVYEKCLIIELRKAGLRVESQKPVPVAYEGNSVGDFTADLVVERNVIVELKSVQPEKSSWTRSQDVRIWRSTGCQFESCYPVQTLNT